MSAVATASLEGRVTSAQTAWRLTSRQTEVLRRLALGDSNKDIAVCLGTSVRTVESHVRLILARASVDSRMRLVAKLWEGAG